MITAHTVSQVRAAEAVLLEAERAVPGRTSRLMLRAASGLAAVVARELGRVNGIRILVLAGSGDNGGDALHAAAMLARRGASVEVLLLGSRAHQEGLAAALAAGGRVVEQPGDPQVILDGILGIGASGGLRSPAAELVSSLASSDAFVVAVDLPSGINPDDGSCPGPVLPADLTVTFGAVKQGLLLPPAAQLTGRIELVPLGLDLPAGAVQRLELADLQAFWPVPRPNTHKYTRGVLGVVAGSADYPGAGVLATRAAAAFGVGMIRFLGSQRSAGLVLAAEPEVVTQAGQVQAWLVGPGIAPEDAELLGRAREAMTSGLPCVVDAGALTLVGELVDGQPKPWLLTPHAGELATLLGDRTRQQVEERPWEAAQQAAGRTGAVVLLKGATTIVVAPEGATYSQAEATPWLAVAGAGDVLAGAAGAWLAGVAAEADHERLARVGAAAASLHGRAARAAAARPGGGSGPIRASDVIDALTTVVVPDDVR